MCKPKLALKYCGFCNPYVDLSRIASHLAQVAENKGDFQLVSLSDNDIALVIVLCGCPRACGNKEELRARAKDILVVAGESVSGQPVPDDSLSDTVERQISKLLSEA